jgi:serine/threonine-protein phosphatase 6 regulatory subunit 3
MPQVADLLLKVLLLDREPTNEPVVDVREFQGPFTNYVLTLIQWLCDQHLMKQLLEKISPQSDVGAHQSTLELIKNIILMSSFTPTPGRKEASVLSSNRLSRDLVSSSNSTHLITHLFPPQPSEVLPATTALVSEPPTDVSANGSNISSFMSTSSTVMELIRKNNSDYFEQYLFLRAREHLMAVQESIQQQNGKDEEAPDCRPELEAAMEEIMSKCGLVNLGTLISAICDHLHLLQERLRRPHSSVSSTAHGLC